MTNSGHAPKTGDEIEHPWLFGACTELGPLRNWYEHFHDIDFGCTLITLSLVTAWPTVTLVLGR
jgi:hypothetical protein